MKIPQPRINRRSTLPICSLNGILERIYPLNMGRYDHPDDIVSVYSVTFLIIHLGCFAVIWTGVTSPALMLGLALYVLRIFAIGAGYHRYFAHRAFRTSRAFQFVLAVLSLTSAQRGILWWVAKHRQHHMHADTAGQFNALYYRPL